jgi:hypothetical protein
MARPGVSHLNLIDGGLSLTDTWRYVACIHYPLGGRYRNPDGAPYSMGNWSLPLKVKRWTVAIWPHHQGASGTVRNWQRATSHVELALAPLKTSGAEFLRPAGVAIATYNNLPSIHPPTTNRNHGRRAKEAA